MFPSDSKLAVKMVQAIYDHFNETGKWVGANALRLSIGPDNADRLEKKYVPKFFVRFPNGVFDHYELTIPGLMKCKGSEVDVELLRRFFVFLADRYRRDPDNKHVKMTEIANGLDIDLKMVDRLRVLIWILLFGTSEVPFESNWGLQLPLDIELLVKGMNVNDYIGQLSDQRFRIDMEYKLRNQKRVDKTKCGFWILMVTQLWSILFLLNNSFLLFHHSLVISGGMWFSLYCAVRVAQLFGVNNRFVNPSKFHEKLIWVVLTAGVALLAGYAPKVISAMTGVL